MSFFSKILEEEITPIEIEDDGARIAGEGKTLVGGFDYICIENPSVVADTRLARALRQQEAENSAWMRERRLERNTQRYIYARQV